MKLPAGETAYVPVDKLAKYLLAPEHPVGRSKAHVLQAAGFDRRTVGLRERALIEIVQTRDVQTVTLTPYGVKYAVEGTIRGPSGREVNLRTVWILDRRRGGRTAPLRYRPSEPPSRGGER